MGQSDPQDAISLYKSRGDAADPIQVIGNKIKGGGPSTIGSGITTGDSAGAYAVIKDNILVDPGNCGIGIAGGHHIQLLNNLVYSRQQPFSRIGMVVNNWNNYEPNCYAHTVQGNIVNWTDKNGNKVPFWNSGNCGSIAGWNNNNWNSDIGPSIQYLKIPSCPQ